MPLPFDARSALTGANPPPDGEADMAWAEGQKAKPDYKKRALVIGLGLLSWVATYVGMLELIEANMGELPIVHRLIIGFSVAMLMTMVVWLLDELFKPNPFVTKVMYAFGYLFLTVISVGFGFGFYWKVLESRSEASRSAEGAVTQVQGSLVAASTRLDQLTATLDQLTGVSVKKAQIESTNGTSCPNSKPGDGPRRKLRDDDAARFSFAADFVKGRATAVKTEMSALDVDLARITSDDKTTIDAKSGTRNAFMQQLGRKLDNTVTGFNAFRTDPQLKQIRTDLADRAERVTFPDSQGKTYSCPDGQLQTALRGVVRAIDQLPELEKPKIAAVEGSEATIEAFRRLTASFYGLASFKMPPSADELRELQKKAIQSVEQPASAARHAMAEQPGLSKRDYVPLAIAIFVDLCLLLVSMGKSHDRLGGLLPKMRKAENGPVIQILSRFNDIHRDQQIRENFELFRHVVFDFHGDYYVAVPLDAPRNINALQRNDLRLEAQLLSNLFASFEKEKIFTRVYSPFLSSRAIRKRLARQGSKFEASEAFRLYRFKDGAWSDIILGAVMGAARRVEAQKRVLARGEAVAAQTLEAASPSARAPSGWRDVMRDRDAPNPGPVLREEGTGRDRKLRTGTADDAYADRFGAYAPFVADDMAWSSYGRNVHPLPSRTSESDFARAPSGREEMTGRPGEAPSFDRGIVPAANSNTAPASPVLDRGPAEVVAFAAPSGSRASVNFNTMGSLAVDQLNDEIESVSESTPLPASQNARAWQDELAVVMTRVTESIRMPVTSAAQLPVGFSRDVSSTAFSPEKAVFPPSEANTAPSITAPIASKLEEWSAADGAIARKYATTNAT